MQAGSQVSIAGPRSPCFKQVQVYELAHLKIAERRWVNPIAAIVGNAQEIGIGRAAHDAVEIDDAVEGTASSNPGVDLVAYFRFCVVPARIVGIRRPVM